MNLNHEEVRASSLNRIDPIEQELSFAPADDLSMADMSSAAIKPEAPGEAHPTQPGFKSLIGANTLNFLRGSILNLNRNSIATFAIAHDHMKPLTNWNYHVQLPAVVEYLSQYREEVRMHWLVRFFLIANFYPMLMAVYGVMINSSVHLSKLVAVPVLLALVGLKLATFAYFQIRHKLSLRPWFSLLCSIPVLPPLSTNRINDHEYSLHKLTLIPTDVKIAKPNPEIKKAPPLRIRQASKPGKPTLLRTPVKSKRVLKSGVVRQESKTTKISSPASKRHH